MFLKRVLLSQENDELLATFFQNDDKHRIELIAEKEDNLCLLMEEAKDRGVIDSACSRTAAGAEWGNLRMLMRTVF